MSRQRRLTVSWAPLRRSPSQAPGFAGVFDFSSDESGPEYGFLRYCGNRLMEFLPEKDRVWVVEQVVSIEAPEAVKTLRATFHNLFAPAAPAQPAGQP